MEAKMLALLVRSECLASDQLQETYDRLVAMLQAYFTNKVTGRIHILPAKRSLEWLEYPPEIVAGIVTAAAFGEEWLLTKLPVIPKPTIVIECLLGPAHLFEKASLMATKLIPKLKRFLEICELEMQEAQLVLVAY